MKTKNDVSRLTIIYIMYSVVDDDGVLELENFSMMY